MTPQTRILVCTLTYCVFLWATNWQSSTEYHQSAGLTASSYDLRLLGVLLGVVFSIILLKRIYTVMRILMESSVSISRDIKFLSGWSYLGLLYPLFIGYSSHKDSIVNEVPTTTIFEYGGDVSVYSALFSAIAIMLFQFLVRLESLNPENQTFQIENYKV